MLSSSRQRSTSAGLGRDCQKRRQLVSLSTPGHNCIMVRTLTLFVYSLSQRLCAARSAQHEFVRRLALLSSSGFVVACSGGLRNTSLNKLQRRLWLSFQVKVRQLIMYLELQTAHFNNYLYRSRDYAAATRLRALENEHSRYASLVELRVPRPNRRRTKSTYIFLVRSHRSSIERSLRYAREMKKLCFIHSFREQSIVSEIKLKERQRRYGDGKSHK
ncbi:unnamed protein product [Trichogramma brassicae]|uniref:Uncharacterized protein n=1 Tax=Trichogramma brassicae TaxID=86971 RepID=A0A6H5IN77_9HYME|nr:unnamed protein product [Trichogramma brassicae]